MDKDLDRWNRFEYVTADKLWLNFLSPVLFKKGPPAVRYSFLFHSHPLCLQRVEYVKSTKTATGSFDEHIFVCRNCKQLEQERKSAQAMQKKANLDNDRRIAVPHSRTNPNNDYHDVMDLYIRRIPDEQVFQLQEIQSGKVRYTTTVELTGDRKILYYLRGLVPQKELAKYVLLSH